MYDNLRPANFMRHLLRGSGNFQATDIHPVEQCATADRIESKDRERERQASPSVGMPYSPDPNWEKKFNMRMSVMRRANRGGMTMGKADVPEGE